MQPVLSIRGILTEFSTGDLPYCATYNFLSQDGLRGYGCDTGDPLGPYHVVYGTYNSSYMSLTNPFAQPSTATVPSPITNPNSLNSTSMPLSLPKPTPLSSEPSASPPRSLNKGALAGIVTGLILFLAFLLLAILSILRRRRKSWKHQVSSSVEKAEQKSRFQQDVKHVSELPAISRGVVQELADTQRVLVELEGFAN